MISALNHTLDVNPVLYFPLAVSMTAIQAKFAPKRRAQHPAEGTWLWAGSAEAGRVGTKRCGLIMWPSLSRVSWRRRGGGGPSRWLGPVRRLFPLSSPAGPGFSLRAVVCQGHRQHVSTTLAHLLISSWDDWAAGLGGLPCSWPCLSASSVNVCRHRVQLAAAARPHELMAASCVNLATGWAWSL